MFPGHADLRPGLIDEDETCGIKPALILLPLRSPPSDPRSILLAGEHGFFEAESLTIEELPKGSVARLDAPIVELGQERPQRQVGLGSDARVQPLALGSNTGLRGPPIFPSATPPVRR